MAVSAGPGGVRGGVKRRPAGVGVALPGRDGGSALGDGERVPPGRAEPGLTPAELLTAVPGFWLLLGEFCVTHPPAAPSRF